jgi:hypothetical protein
MAKIINNLVTVRPTELYYCKLIVLKKIKHIISTLTYRDHDKSRATQGRMYTPTIILHIYGPAASITL